MATVDAVRVRCPECGATCQADGDVVTCAYCGTRSRVQRRTAFLQRKIALPPDPTSRVAVQQRQVWKTVLSIALPILVAAAILGAMAYAISTKVAWLGEQTVIADVDGDGTSDAIGIQRSLLPDRMRLVALSGRDGHAIWSTPSLGGYSEVVRDRYTVIGAALVLRTERTLEGYALATGAKRWTITPTAAVDAVCAGPSATLGLVVTNAESYTLDLATGALAATPAGRCAPEPAPPGIALPPGAGDAQLAGNDTTIAAVWKESPPSKTIAVAAWDRSTGAPRWTSRAEYAGKMSATIHAILVGKGAIFVAVSSSLQGFDPQTGERRFPRRHAELIAVYSLGCMPTVIGTRVRCPECGASSDAIGDAFKCSYCGTVARVQRRTQFGMKMPLPPPLPVPGFPPPPHRVAVQQMNPVAKAIAVTAGVMGLGVGVMGAMTGLQTSRITRDYKAAQAAHQPAALRAPTAESALLWMSRPLVVDVDGDGTSDAVGYRRQVTPDRIFLSAVSGATGKLLWSTHVGDYSTTYRRPIILAGHAILLGSENDVIQSVSAWSFTGGALFTAKFSEVVSEVCATATPTLIKVVTKDRAESLVDLSTGAVSPVKAKRSKCIALPSNEEATMVSTNFTMPHSRDPVGMANRAYAGHEAPWIIVGHKDPGSQVPMLAAFDNHDKTLWQLAVPGKDPMAVSFGPPTTIAVDKEIVATIYYPTDGRAPTLATFDRMTGARRLDVPVSDRKPDYASGVEVSLGNKVIFVTLAQSLRAFDRETGVPKWLLKQ